MNESKTNTRHHEEGNAVTEDMSDHTQETKALNHDAQLRVCSHIRRADEY